MLTRKVLGSLVVVCTFLVGSFSFAQSSGSSAPLVRMERQTYDGDVCMLVKNDGQYHLERLAPGMGQSRIYEGTLPEASLSDLQKILNTDDFKNLSQAKIQAALVGE